MTIKPEEVLRIEDLTVSQNQNEDEDDARQDALRKELEGVKNLNHVIESVITAMTKAKDNMDAVGNTVENADRLLDIWIKVLSQAEHTQRLLLDGKWQGSIEDARVQEERIRQEEAAAALAASQAAELARQKAAEAAEKAKLEAARAATSAKTPTRGRGILKNSTATATRGGVGRGTAQTASVRGRGTVARGVRGTSTTRGSVRGRGSLVK